MRLDKNFMVSQNFVYTLLIGGSLFSSHPSFAYEGAMRLEKPLFLTQNSAYTWLMRGE